MKALLALLSGLLLSGCAYSESKPMPKKHHLPDGTFRNNYLESIDKPCTDLIKWRWNAERTDPISFPLAQNDPAFLKQNRTEPTLTWIGHATFLLQYDGLNVLTDPHLTRRASPVSFAGPERSRPPA